MSETEDGDLPSKVGDYIHACVTISKAVEDTDCLPRSIRVLLPRLTLIQEGLASTSKRLDADSVSDVYRATLNEVLKKCIVRAKWLNEIFNDMVPPAEASKAKKTLKKMRTASKAAQIDKVIDEIMKYLQTVPKNEALNTDKKVNTEGPAEDNKNVEQQVQEDHKGGAKDSSNNKSGPQGKYNHNGNGHQNIAMDKSFQFNGQVSGGNEQLHSELSHYE
ncbi:uncharacterized protein TrAtP1_013141 [Trichoderma atroviride]|uniref:uncharacterized protein n=1 Tax=Hypocrea atroviridis TaxID=63577 RepID=UPI0033201897|nr:hypothetical protein TrAtP1_013141 [Trichoderma atroviride]